MWRYSANLRALYETPAAFETDVTDAARAQAAKLIATVRSAGRTLLTEAESKGLLAIYGIPTVPTEIAAQRRSSCQSGSPGRVSRRTQAPLGNHYS